MKEQIKETHLPKKIKKISFGVFSSQEIHELSEIEICNRELYTATKDNVSSPTRMGCLDRRLGVSDKNSVCETCGLKLADCAGHFGHIKLELPVYHIGYFKAIITILQTICKTCSRILLNEDEKLSFLKRIRNPSLDSLQKQSLLKAVYSCARKVVFCPCCNSINGLIKKVSALKIVHEKYNLKKTMTQALEFRKTFENAIVSMPEIKALLGKTQDDINPLKCKLLFKRINSEDCELLGINLSHGHPESFIWDYLIVPPSCIRPSVEQETGSNEDDITVKLTEIIYTNLVIRDALVKGSPINVIMEDWNFLQLQTAIYINSELPSIPLSMHSSSKPIRGFCQRLKGKTGRFRGNLSGKRVDFSSRTVISPDPNVRIGHVVVPIYVAKILTFPEKVTDFNIAKLRALVLKGPDNHPGANFVQMAANGFKKSLKYGDRNKTAKDLKIGDIVERHLADGDVVLFNRQPSLHKLSIMAHFVQIKPWRTFRFNECTCAPFNADFDGDEMNLHLPQTQEARAEAIELMGAKFNLVTPRNGQPVISATQDFITTSYLLSSKDIFYNKKNYCKVVSYMFDAAEHIDIPMPSIIKPLLLWTGKQVFNVLMRPNKASNVLVNVETKTRSFSKVPGEAFDLCPNDGYLVVRNSQIMIGALDKSTVGDGSKYSLFYVLLRDYGPDIAVSCMTRLSKLSARWIGEKGFSIGIGDVQPGLRLRKMKDSLVQEGYDECDKNIRDFKLGKLKNQPGCTAAQSLEAVISRILSKIRDDVGQICLEELSNKNAPLIMQWCGSKGSKINVSQMVSCVGQQIISGSRIPDGFTNRSLPHFLINSKTPAAKGFVQNSFYSGLSPTEFFFHAVSGREGLVDTAVKTAETGYMQRRLMKALEDLFIHYDLSVRNSRGGMVQFYYGDDGLDPTNMEGDDVPVNFSRSLIHSKAICSSSGSYNRLSPKETLVWAKTLMEALGYKKLTSETFIDSLLDFIQKALVEPSNSIVEKYAKKTPGVDYNGSESVLDYISKVTREQLEIFLKLCLNKYIKSKVEPGTAVGALGAQSIGEPGTQMTLKTFHFAGVASMNVTLGVPRIKEIINASKNISTPIITASLVNSTNSHEARIVKGRLEKTLLGDITEYIEEVYGNNESYISFKLDLGAIKMLQLEIDAFTVQRALLKSSKLKLTESQVLVGYPDKFRILLSNKNLNSELASGYLALKKLKRELPKTLIRGITSVNRAVINDLNDGTYNLLVEGHGLKEVMATEGIDGLCTTSNHIIEIQQVIGIEAARKTIANEIQYTMGKHGMTIDMRHVILLADLMTFKGEILGITRFGISKMNDSVLMLASFEKNYRSSL